MDRHPLALVVEDDDNQRALLKRSIRRNTKFQGAFFIRQGWASAGSFIGYAELGRQCDIVRIASPRNTETDVVVG
jgi:hypothetical protein